MEDTFSNKPKANLISHGFKGLLRIISIADVLNILQTGMKTGCLLWTLGEKQHYIYIESGAIVYASSTSDEGHLIKWLYAHPDLRTATIDSAVSLGLEGDELLRHLSKEQLLRDAEMEDFIRSRVICILADALRRRQGSFEFVEGKAPVNPLHLIRLDIPFAVMLAAQDVDESGEFVTSREGNSTGLEIESRTVAVDPDDCLKISPVKPERRGKKPPRRAKLTHIFQSRVLNTYLLGSGSKVIGRGESAHIRLLDDRTVSRYHARILGTRGHYLLEDLESSNGVLVNGQMVKRCELKPGDEITIGAHVLLFQLLTAL